jgi:hypothetical protein
VAERLTFAVQGSALLAYRVSADIIRSGAGMDKRLVKITTSFLAYQ